MNGVHGGPYGLVWCGGLFLMAALCLGAPRALAGEPGLAKLRVLVTTDAGGDPDDEASLVRFLLYSNEWDVEGIIADRPKTSNQGATSGFELVMKIVGAYAECYSNLVRHKPDYPSPDYLRQRTVRGYDSVDDGVRLALRALTSDDPRPLWYANWGSNSGTEDPVKRALDRLKKEGSPQAYARVMSRLRLSRNAEKLGEHAAQLPLFVDTRNPGKWYHRFAPLTASAGGCDVKRDVKAVGPLGKVYSTPKEGDSMSFIYWIPTGLSDPSEPTWGGWGGRYGPMTEGEKGLKAKDGFYCANAEDTWSGATSRDNTLARFAAALQNDFRARLQWSVTSDYAKANHEPLVVCQGDRTRRVLRVAAPAGKPLELDASGTSDPDGDRLSYRWWVYPEAGTFGGPVPIEGADRPAASVRVPAGAAGKAVHVVLEVTDDGAPPLTRYRRVVIDVTE